MELVHLRTTLNKYTFKSKKIREWVEQHCSGRTLNLFAGQTKLDVNEYRNDIRPDMPADSHKDALMFVLEWSVETQGKFNTIILDPPYSYRKAMELYDGAMSSTFNAVKDSLSKVLAPNGKVITCGYHSVSMGKCRDFTVESVCIISHGGAIHDTIISVERYN